MTVLDRITEFLERSSDVVILRAEVVHLGSASQVGRVLARLVHEKRLVRVINGAYVRTRKNKFTGELTAEAPLETIANILFAKLGIEVSPGRAARDYNAGRTTQIPVAPVVRTGRRRISRRVQLGSRAVVYDRGSHD